MTDERIEIVRRGYDEIADAFVEWRDRIKDDPRRRLTEQLVSRLAEGARVLDLGCGAGAPDTQLLAERFRVTGVDVSAEQIRRARTNVPDAEFLQADFTSLELEPGSFDAVVAYYSFNHVPRNLLAGLFARVHGWLVPGGLFLTALGSSDLSGWVGEFVGATMFFSGWPPETNRRLLRDAGFELVIDELATMREPEGDATFHWILAQR